jgi:hypothetical protein
LRGVAQYAGFDVLIAQEPFWDGLSLNHVCLGAFRNRFSLRTFWIIPSYRRYLTRILPVQRQGVELWVA